MKGGNVLKRAKNISEIFLFTISSIQKKKLCMKNTPPVIRSLYRCQCKKKSFILDTISNKKIILCFINSFIHRRAVDVCVSQNILDEIVSLHIYLAFHRHVKTEEHAGQDTDHITSANVHRVCIDIIIL